jgi:hypothetical protein
VIITWFIFREVVSNNEFVLAKIDKYGIGGALRHDNPEDFSIILSHYLAT